MFNPFGVAGFNARYYRGFHPRLLSLNPFGIRLKLNAFHHGLNNRGMFMLNPFSFFRIRYCSDRTKLNIQQSLGGRRVGLLNLNPSGMRLKPNNPRLSSRSSSRISTYNFRVQRILR